MGAPYGLDIIEQCSGCGLRSDRLFRDLSPDVVHAFDAIKSVTVYPGSATLFVEGQAARGIFMLCSGRAKLSTTSHFGKTAIVRFTGQGEILGLGATVSGNSYEATAETVGPCHVVFVRRDEFLEFLRIHGDASLVITEHLAEELHHAYEQIRLLTLSRSAAEKFARLLLGWCDSDGVPTEGGIRLKVTRTHEEIAQVIDVSRETVSRLFAEFKGKGLMRLSGSTLIVPDPARLEALVRS